MADQDSQLYITDAFDKRLPKQTAEDVFFGMVSLMDLASQAADEQEGLIQKPIEAEVEIVS